MLPANFNVGDIVQTKKKHPCGCDQWMIVRTGIDVKIKCLQCERIIMLPRLEFRKKVKKIIKSTPTNEDTN
jgi:hypothetical protein